MPYIPANVPLVERELHDHPVSGKVIIIRRKLTAEPERIWAALTQPDQIIRWYLPLDGDLREGGYYALIGNAVGEIRRCSAPRELALTWIYGEFESELILRLSPYESGTLFELAHGKVPIEMVLNPTPGLWGFAVNWEMVLSGLDDYLAGRCPDGAAIEWMPRVPQDVRASQLAHADELNDAWATLVEPTS